MTVIKKIRKYCFFYVAMENIEVVSLCIVRAIIQLDVTFYHLI